MFNRPSGEAVTLLFTAAFPDGQTRLAAEEVWGAMICAACFACYGELEVRGPTPVDAGPVSGPKVVSLTPIYLDGDELRRLRRSRQHCECEREHGREEERWSGFDFNCYFELCRCCGLKPLRSGSRWSPFFCRGCQGRVLDLNRSHGRWVIPIGRHSVMHGILIANDEATDERSAERFVTAARGLFAATHHLDEYRRIVVEENLAVLGFAPGAEAELRAYLDGADESGLDKQAAFDRLVDHFAEPAA